jgi:hypothetical protein
LLKNDKADERLMKSSEVVIPAGGNPESGKLMKNWITVFTGVTE